MRILPAGKRGWWQLYSPGDHVAAALDDQTELTEDNVRGLEWFDEFYPGGKNGDTRYQIWGLGEDAQLTAVALVGNGEVTVQKPSEGHAYLYFFTGQKMIFISMWRISLKATAFLLLIVGWFWRRFVLESRGC